jgi:hypothetical protein
LLVLTFSSPFQSGFSPEYNSKEKEALKAALQECELGSATGFLGIRIAVLPSLTGVVFAR